MGLLMKFMYKTEKKN